jgi:hypothetical protein
MKNTYAPTSIKPSKVVVVEAVTGCGDRVSVQKTGLLQSIKIFFIIFLL